MWIARIAGANGIFYFVHEWQPSFREDGLFRYPDTVAEITQINAQVRKLAPVLNSPSLTGQITVEASVEIATTVKRHADATYVFAVNMQKKAAAVRLQFTDPAGSHAVVLGEDRIVKLEGGAIRDAFEEYGVRLYKIPDKG